VPICYTCAEIVLVCTLLTATFVGPRGDQQEKELKEAFDTIDADRGGTTTPIPIIQHPVAVPRL